jgi:hypothetical protein
VGNAIKQVKTALNRNRSAAWQPTRHPTGSKDDRRVSPPVTKYFSYLTTLHALSACSAYRTDKLFSFFLDFYRPPPKGFVEQKFYYDCCCYSENKNQVKNRCFHKLPLPLLPGYFPLPYKEYELKGVIMSEIGQACNGSGSMGQPIFDRRDYR